MRVYDIIIHVTLLSAVMLVNLRKLVDELGEGLVATEALDFCAGVSLKLDQYLGLGLKPCAG